MTLEQNKITEILKELQLEHVELDIDEVRRICTFPIRVVTECMKRTDMDDSKTHHYIKIRNFGAFKVNPISIKRIKNSKKYKKEHEKI